jgi:acylphosphatase
VNRQFGIFTSVRIARKFLVHGIVQGVGFRFFAQRAAARHQVVGYIRNLADGKVEARAEGNAQSVEAFKQELLAGPTFSVVDNLEEIVVEPSDHYKHFRIEK